MEDFDNVRVIENEADTPASYEAETIEEAQETNDTENDSSENGSDDLHINSEAIEEPVYYEDYMELEFFTGESFPMVLSSSIISGFGLATIFFLIGFAIFKAVSLININKEKGD